MPLVEVGFFRELRHGHPDGPSLLTCLRSFADADDEKVAHYLEGGATLAATGSMVDDVLDDSRRAVARLEVATDGNWTWPRDLAYYVRQHHARLPAAFVDHMRGRDWRSPNLAKEDLIKLAVEYRQAPSAEREASSGTSTGT